MSPLAAAAPPPAPQRRRYTSFPDELPAEGAVVDHSAAFERDLLASLPAPASLTTETDLTPDMAYSAGPAPAPGGDSPEPVAAVVAPKPERAPRQPRRRTGFQPVPADAPLAIEAVAAGEAAAPAVAPSASAVTEPVSALVPAWMAEASAIADASTLASSAPAPCSAGPVSAPGTTVAGMPAEIALPGGPPVALEPVSDQPAPLPEATIDVALPVAAEKKEAPAELVPEPAAEPRSAGPVSAPGTSADPNEGRCAPREDELELVAARKEEQELVASTASKVKPITVLPVSLPAAARSDFVGARTGTAPVWGTAAPALHAESGHPEPEWRREVSNRVEAYRARRQRDPNDPSQSDLPFAGADASESARAVGASFSWPHETPSTAAHATEAAGPASTRPPEAQADLQAIAARAALRYAARGRQNDTMEIATVQPELDFAASAALDDHPHAPLVPVADVADRRAAGLLDAGLLVISYALFLILFSSLGGKLSWGKVDALIYAATFFLFYAQYFALFTVFGGATPGMLVRGLRVVAFDGTAPAPGQLLWRSAGYLASAAALFLGFLWPLWDEDHLTWHDRMSHTYLTHTLASASSGAAAPQPGATNQL